MATHLGATKGDMMILILREGTRKKAVLLKSCYCLR